MDVCPSEMKQSMSDVDGPFEVSHQRRPSNRLTFYDLPFDIRNRIYGFVPLIRTYPINLNFKFFEHSNPLSYYSVQNDLVLDYQDGNPNHPYSPSPDYDCQPIPWGLLCASREASRIFYSRNHFKVCQSWPGHFLALQNLTAESLSALTTVSIRINFCPGCRTSIKLLQRQN